MIKRIAIIIVGIVVVVLGRGFFFYSGFYTPLPGEVANYEGVVVPPAPSGEFTDNISANISAEEKKTVLIDLAHENNFEVEELNVLLLRLISRGLKIKFLDKEDNLKELLLGKEKEEIEEEEEPAPSEDEEEPTPLKEELSSEEEEEEEEELPPVAFIIVCPQSEFSDEDKETIDEFVDNGGKILLIGDPTRKSDINDIALEFSLIFEPDYLYNMKENEINYRNIFITEFEESALTKNLNKIALYAAGSISSNQSGLAFTDENTFSTVIESRKRLSPLALVEKTKVLGVHDLTFMTEPYNGILDNNQLIANIADWLASPVAKEEAAKPAE